MTRNQIFSFILNITFHICSKLYEWTPAFKNAERVGRGLVELYPGKCGEHLLKCTFFTVKASKPSFFYISSKCLRTLGLQEVLVLSDHLTPLDSVSCSAASHSHSDPSSTQRSKPSPLVSRWLPQELKWHRRVGKSQRVPPLGHIHGRDQNGAVLNIPLRGEFIYWKPPLTTACVTSTNFAL